MDWGTRQHVANQAAADGALATLQISFPEVESAYVPSGKVPPGGIVALLLGSGLGVPIGGLAAALVGGITVMLFVLLGLLIALIAFCGWVVCISVVIEIGIALIGGGLTFAAAGFVPGWITAFCGRYGKNRSPTVAALMALPSTVGAYAILVVTPQVLAMFVDPPSNTDDVSFAGFVHMLDGFTWVHIAVWIVGFVIALGVSWVAATGEVGAQKFCEPCNEYMDEIPMHGMTFDFAKWAFGQIVDRQAANLAQHFTQSTGLDVEPTVFECPSCHVGFFEARAHFFAEWTGPKDTENTRRDWLCRSVATASDQTPDLALCRRLDETR